MNLDFNFCTPNKAAVFIQETTQALNDVQSRLQQLTNESAAQQKNYDPESQMTQKILCEDSVDSKERCDDTQIKNLQRRLQCPSKTLFDDNEESELINTQKLTKAISKQNNNNNTNKVQFCQKLKEFADRKKLSSSKQVNAILNRPSIKDRYAQLLSTSVLILKNEVSKKLNSLMLSVEQKLFCQVTRTQISRDTSILLSQLMQTIPNLDILTMQQLVNVHPQLYCLSLYETPYGRDLLVRLPSQDENIQTVQQWRTHRAQDYKQRLYYQEQLELQQQQQQSNDSGEEQHRNINSSINLYDLKLTQTIKATIESYSYSMPTIQAKETCSISKVAETLKKYFELRGVSNIFRMSVVAHLGKNLEINNATAERYLVDLMEMCPAFLTEVKSSLIAPILRINAQVDISQFF